MLDEKISSALYSALHDPIGVCIRVTAGDRDLLRSKIYAVKRALQDPALEEIQVSYSRTSEEELWLMRKNPGKDLGGEP